MYNKEGKILQILLRAYAIKEKNIVTGLVGVHTDITHFKQLEEHGEKLDRINQIIIRSNEQKVMLEETLDALLDIFRCDRAWLLYPCDPTAPSFRVPIERTRPEWPGASARNLELPLDRAASETFGRGK